MSPNVEIPFPPRPSEPHSPRLDPPWVSIEPRWEYKELVRDSKADGLPSETELNELGKEHWELAGVIREDDRVHFYFKRERPN
jgi:hypothetical protein